MLDLKLPTHRRGFLGRIAASAAALGLGELVPGAVAGQEYAPSAGTAHAGASQDPALTAWLNRIKGKYRQVFDTPEPNGGFAFAWARVFYMTNAETGATDADTSVVIVLRHRAIPFAMGDDAWAKYKFGEVFHINDPETNAPSVRNFLYKAPPEKLPLPGMGIDQLLATGTLMGVCNMAIKFYAGQVGPKMNMTADQVRADWTAAVLPGIQVVPSGVWAVNRTQQHGCTYCFAG
jgi:intracellular sulfur oxidation DsrE/DsrF family protein